MTTTVKSAAPTNSAFQLKGSLFTLTVLHLQTTDIDAFRQQLEKTVKQVPKFFTQMPVVIDLQKLATANQSLDLTGLMICLREQNVVPIGIRGGNAKQQQAALDYGLAVLPLTKTEMPETTVASANSPVAPAPTSQHILSKLVTHPVRSGQQIYARNADLIVMAPVSAGAELIADGHIHIYGTLRGRALAGVSGNEGARIFCKSLEADLVAIAGHYWLSEDLQKNSLKQHVTIYLENDKLQISAL